MFQAVKPLQVCLSQGRQGSRLYVTGHHIGSLCTQKQPGVSASIKARLFREHCISCSRSVAKRYCYLALVALSKDFVLVHGLHKCLDGVDKGEASAVDLHDPKHAMSSGWIKLAVMATQQGACRVQTLQDRSSAA